MIVLVRHIHAQVINVMVKFDGKIVHSLIIHKPIAFIKLMEEFYALPRRW